MRIWTNENWDHQPARRESKSLAVIPEQHGLLSLARVDYHLDRRPLDIQVARYSERTWAVWVNGELVAVTAYRKGAEQIRELMEEMMALLMAEHEGPSGSAEVG